MLAVLAFHCGAPGFGGGFVGVDVFFVISGYLICGILWKELNEERFSLARFYQRRCKRILPALFAVLVFCVAAGWLLLSPYELRQLGEGVAATTLSVSNVDFYRHGNYFFRPSLNPLLMTWSLAVEEQFYIGFPLLLWALFRWARKRVFMAMVVMCVVSLLLSVKFEFGHPEFNFYMPFTRAWELGAGCLLALWEKGRPGRAQGAMWVEQISGGAGLLMIVLCMVFYSAATRFPGYEAIPPVLGAVLLLRSPRSAANSVLRLKPVVAVGLISYSLYLWHWPLLSFASIVCTEPLTGKVKALLMGLATVAAIGSYYAIEQPVRNMKSGRPRNAILLSVVAIALFAAAGLAFFKTGGMPGRSPVLAATEKSLELSREHPCLVGGDFIKYIPECVPGVSATPAVALMGDSHAEALEGELREQAQTAGYKLLSMELYSCPPLQGVTRFLATDPTHAAICSRFNKHTLALVTSRPDVKVVVLAGSWAMVQDDVFAPDAFAGEPQKIPQENRVQYLEEGLRAEIAALEAAGKRVVLVDDVPSLLSSPIDAYRAQKLPWRGRLMRLLQGAPKDDGTWGTVARAETLTPGAERVKQDLLAIGRDDPKVTVINSKPAFCDAVRCRFSDGTNLFYIDNNHVSRFGARMFLGSLDLKAER